MPPSAPIPASEESLRAEAAEWFARMRGSEAERSRQEFEAWLAAEPAHRQAYDRMALRWDQSRLVGHTPSGRARRGLSAGRARIPSGARFGMLAASLAAVVGVGSIYLLSPGVRHAPPTRVAATELASAIGTIRRETLADGSMVTLDTATRIQVAFTAGERRLRLLAGRARFEVAHDSARPFVVVAGEGEVVATGTVFDVSLIGAAPRVRLIQGSIEVRRRVAGTAAPRMVAHLLPGQTVPLNVPEAVPTAAAGGDRWVSGILSFDDTPLVDAVAEANRYSPRAIHLESPELGALRVTGGFKAGDQDAIAQGLAAGFGLVVDRPSTTRLVLRRAPR